MTGIITIAELLDKPHGRDALVYVLTAMDERWPRLSDGVFRPTEFWLLAGTAVKVLQDVEWLATAIIHVAKLHWANVGDQDTDDAHINVWHDSTLHPVTNRQIDQVVAWELDQEKPVIHSMDSARKVLLTLLRMDASKRDMDVVYDLLLGKAIQGQT